MQELVKQSIAKSDTATPQEQESLIRQPTFEKEPGLSVFRGPLPLDDELVTASQCGLRGRPWAGHWVCEVCLTDSSQPPCAGESDYLHPVGGTYALHRPLLRSTECPVASRFTEQSRE